MKVVDINSAIAEYESGSSSWVDKSLYDLLKKQLTKITSIVGDPIE